MLVLGSFLALTILFIMVVYLWSYTRQKNAVAEEKRWFAITEPKLREQHSYPDDWQMRRTLTYLRTGGRCERCRKSCARLLCKKDRIWYYPNQKLVVGAHIHHLKPLSDGGNHCLTNLQLLCPACHGATHPDILSLSNPELASKLRPFHRAGRPVEKRARKAWSCCICRRQIKPGRSYYRAGTAVSCSSCFKKYGQWLGDHDL